MLVNRSNVGQQGGREGGRPSYPYFWEGGGWLFFFMEAHCAPLRKQRFACRDTGISLIFSRPSPPRGKSLPVTQFTFSKFTLCQKISIPVCILSKFTLDVCIYIYIYICIVENRETRKKRESVRCIYGKWPEKNILIFPSFLSCKIVFQIKTYVCPFLRNRMYLILRRVRNRIFFSNKKIIVLFFNDPDLTFLAM